VYTALGTDVSGVCACLSLFWSTMVYPVKLMGLSCCSTCQSENGHASFFGYLEFSRIGDYDQWPCNELLQVPRDRQS
jgi:hypothetical protein